MYSQPLADAIAEAESLVAAAPFIESEADLLEGLQYLAGCIAGVHPRGVRLRPRPSVPAQSAPGPSPRWAWTTRTRMYFGTRVQPGHEYVVTGRRGTTTDLSFQLLGGEYTDDNVPDSRDGVRRPQARHRRRRHLRVAVHAGQRRPSWSFVRCTTTGPRSAASFAIARTDTAGTAPPPLTQRTHRKALRRRGQAARPAGQDVAAVPAVVLRHAAGQHHGGAAADPRRAGHPVLVGRALRPDAGPGARSSRCPSPTRRISASSSAASGTSRWTTSTTRRR